MEINIELRKSLEENASAYFEKSKQAKKKAEKIKDAIKLSEEKIEKLKKDQENVETKITKKRKQDWFEKFRWFYSSTGFLVIAGRDKSSNETVVKKYMEPSDVYFHSDIHGAPHCIIKTNGKKPDEETKKQAAIFAASFSKAWRENFASLDVYSVKPEQVSKSAPTGEALGSGAFMIYGKREWFKKTPIQLAIGLEKIESEYRVISGPEDAIKKHSAAFLSLKQGDKSSGKIAKEIKHFFNKKLGALIDLDEIIRMLPSGKSSIK